MIVYRELSSLVRDLGVEAKTLYALSNSLEKHYHQVKIPKRDGGYRQLSVPDEQLKRVQRQIDRVLLARMTVSPYATAYRCGCGIGRNALPHLGQPGVLKLDIRHFFDSIPYTAVKERAFPGTIYGEPLRVLLTMLCYYRDSLPQGAPSSPAITNIIMAEFDARVGQWCAQREIRYTRYCDDMTFSGSFDPQEVVAFVRPLLREMGFFLNEKKTRFLPAGCRQVVTGIVVNEKPGLPAEYLRRLRQEVYFCQKYGTADHMARCGIQGPASGYLRRLLGRVNYGLQILPGKKELLEARAWLMKEMAREQEGDRP